MLFNISFLIGFIPLFCLSLQAKHEESPPIVNEKKEETDWNVGGKIHFEKDDGPGYVGTRTLNKLAKDVLNEVFLVDKEKCSNHSKLLFLKGANGKFTIHHYEEKTNPGIGEEMHATLLYTRKRFANGHETLKDVYKNLKTINPNLPHDHPPSVKEIAKTYQKVINPNWKFEISHVEFISGSAGSLIVARLIVNGKDEFITHQDQPISGNFLHISLVNVDPTVLFHKEDEKKIHQATQILDKLLSGKSVKIAEKNGLADLEFGISGSTPQQRERP